MKTDKLLICAHPDDETLFFGGLLLTHPGEFKVICVTDANADGRGTIRMSEFEKALEKLQVTHFSLLKFPDLYDKRININSLSQAISNETKDDYKEVFTHNILGEYGHPHHQDVSFCVHNLFRCPVYSTAYNAFPEKIVHLTHSQFAIKSDILTHIYGEETRRFLNLLPITWQEGFQQTDLVEVKAIYDYLTGNGPLTDLNHFVHLESYLKHLRKQNRPF